MVVSRRGVAIFVLRWLAVLATLGALGYGVRQLFDTADRRGAQEAAEDAARSNGRNRRGTTTTSAAAAAVPTLAPTTTAVASPTGPVEPASLEASDTEGDKPDSCGRRVNYDVRNLADWNTSTAWRAPGDGVGAKIWVRFAGPTRLSQVGLVPGYAKVDECSNLDRFTQLRRVTSVVWRFDGGKVVPQSFKDRPEMQGMAVDVVTTAIEIEITGTTNEPKLDAVAISELLLVGSSAA